VPLLRPVPMVKVGLVGLKNDREVILSVLHDLGIAQVEPLSKEALSVLEPEHGSEQVRAVGDQLIRFRGLRSALPPVPITARGRFQTLDEVLAQSNRVPVDEEVGRLVREADQLTTQKKGITDELDLLARFAFYTDRFELLSADHILSFFGETTPELFERLRRPLTEELDVQFLHQATEDTVRFIAIVPRPRAETAIRQAQQAGVALTAVPKLTGTRAEIAPRLEGERSAIDTRLATIRGRLTEISQEWYGTVVALEEAFAIENRKLEVWTRMGAGDRTFALEAWVPKRSRMVLERAVQDATQGRVYVYDIPTHDLAPTLMENPKGFRWFEFFVKFYSIPQSNEWDPTFVFAITFTLFFGIMLGDWGYGLVILLISLWMIRGFPGRRGLPKSIKNFVKLIMGPSAMQRLALALIPGCLVAIGLGVVYDEFFGFQVIHSLLPAYTGINASGTRTVSTLLIIAGYIGLGMVVLGFLMGALKEYFHRNYRGALAKVGGIFFAFAIAAIGLALIHIHSPGSPGLNPFATSPPNVLLLGAFVLVVAGPLLLVFGEGAQAGMMGIIEVVSHILSYTRLVGIFLASVILALVINKISLGLFGSGNIGLFVVGLVILLIGQTFNVIIGVFEPGIQGARLIFVEYFSKFYTGNGRPFRPFGSKRTYTEAQYGPASLVGGSASQTPDR
jgi:V/A-type H+-transporting ATPase subunit I